MLATGSQGEPTSVLSRMAMGDHPNVRIIEEDTVIFSAGPIPGNEETVARAIDNLYRRGAKVIYRAINEGVHVSGHSSQEELKHMLDLLRPKFCVPIHGEYRMLVLYKELAVDTGIPAENVVIADIGEVIEITQDEIADQRHGPVRIDAGGRADGRRRHAGRPAGSEAAGGGRRADRGDRGGPGDWRADRRSGPDLAGHRRSAPGRHPGRGPRRAGGRACKRCSVRSRATASWWARSARC